MSVLDAVMAYKQNQQALQQQQGQAIGQAFQNFQQARQQAIMNSFMQKNYKAGLAEKGLAEDNSTPSGYKYDPSTLNPLQQVMMAGQGQANAKTAGNKQLYDLYGGAISGLLGKGSQGQIPGQVSPSTLQSVQGNAVASQIPALTGGTGSVSPQTASGTDSLVQSGANTETDPFSGITTQKNTFISPGAEATKTSATDIAKAQTEAQIGKARDTAQFGMIAQGLKNLNDIHKELSDKGFAGNAWSNGVIDNYNKIPNIEGLRDKLVPPDVQNLAGKFVSARNEALVKVQPILSQQFGQAGTSRIMESLVDLSKGEFGDLNTPHAKFEGQTEGTLGSLFRIKAASDKYLDLLKQSGQSIKDIPNTPEGQKRVIDGISSQMTDLTSDQKKELQNIVDSTLGRKKSDNPIKNSISEEDIQHTLKLHPEYTREKLLQKLGK